MRKGEETAEYFWMEKRTENSEMDIPSSDTLWDLTDPVDTLIRTTRVPRMGDPCNLDLLNGECFIYGGHPSMIHRGPGSPDRAEAILS